MTSLHAVLKYIVFPLTVHDMEIKTEIWLALFFRHIAIRSQTDAHFPVTFSFLHCCCICLEEKSKTLLNT